jgi:hypothetical protein
LANALPIVAGKGGSLFSDFAEMAAKVGGAKIIVSVNAYTDTTNSVAAFAQYALTNHIPVAAWELANEPYTWISYGRFTNSADYAAQMKPFRDAIKVADSNAVVALFFSDAGNPNAPWDKALASYTNHYWDAVTHHQYITPVSTQGGNGKRYVVLINKGASNLVASIKQDGVTQGNGNTNKFLETFVSQITQRPRAVRWYNLIRGLLQRRSFLHQFSPRGQNNPFLLQCFFEGRIRHDKQVALAQQPGTGNVLKYLSRCGAMHDHHGDAGL